MPERIIPIIIWTRAQVASTAILSVYDHYSHLVIIIMRKIQLKDAKATLSAVVDEATRGACRRHHCGNSETARSDRTLKERAPVHAA
jgi:hypothetical protein